MTLVASRRNQRDRTDGAFLLVAFGTPQAAHHIIESGIPASERRQRVRMTPSYVAAWAFQIDDVLSERVIELVDGQVAHEHDCTYIRGIH